jgi:glycosyltransferase involved in cell wall biosynthesis
MNKNAPADRATPDGAGPLPDRDRAQPPIPLFWESPPFAHHSFSTVTREAGKALLRRSEIDLVLFPNGPSEFDPAPFPEFASLIAVCAQNKLASGRPASGPRPIMVRLQFPLRPFPPPRATWVVYHPWEYSRASLASVEVMNRAREIWTTSQFCVEAFVRSGVPAKKIHIIPNGIDPAVYQPTGARAALPTLKPFRFLYVGGTIYRKGTDILLKAYGKAFTSADPVSLIIKDFGGTGIYPYEKGAEFAAEFSANPSHPEVIHLSAHRSSAEMAELYRACDVFVSSYRGEGFCLPALEAMACGKPVIVTQGGATDDFVSDAVGWRIPATLRSTGGTVFNVPLDGEAELFEPDVDALAELLRTAFRDEAARQSRGDAGAEAARAWTWDAAADKIVTRCQALAAAPV